MTRQDCVKILCSICLMSSMLVAPALQAADKTVLIGYAGPLTGASAPAGLNLLRAVEMAVDDANRSDIRVQGERLVFKLISQDDRADPATGVLVAEYLVKVGVIGVIGHWNSGVSIPASRIYAKAGIAQLASASTAKAYTQQNLATSFRMVGHDDEGADLSAEYVLRQLRARRIAIVDDRTIFGAGYAEQFSRSILASGGNIVARYTVSSKTSDFNAVLKEMALTEPDVVFFGGLDTQAGQFARDLKRFNISARLVSVDGTVGQPFLNAAGSAGEGAIAVEPGLPAYKGAQWKRFERIYRERAGSTMELFAPFSYDGVGVLVAAVKEANSLDPKKITAALHQIRYEGITGLVSFDAEGNLRNPAFTVYQVKNANWVPVKMIGSRR